MHKKSKNSTNAKKNSLSHGALIKQVIENPYAQDFFIKTSLGTIIS